VRLRTWLECARWLASPGRTRPLSSHWGFDRGTPVDRWYIERWLAGEAQGIAGSVLEAMDTRYTTLFGTGVTDSHVLDIESANPEATLRANLERPEEFPEAAFDCVLLTQTLHYVYDLRGAVSSIHRTLRPGGVCLATVPLVSRLDQAVPPGQECWRFTGSACSRLFGERFGADRVTVREHGNVRAAVAFLLGLAAEELSEQELAAEDPYFPILTTVRAVREG
jgi:SAM-dependent methyltransferase